MDGGCLWREAFAAEPDEALSLTPRTDMVKAEHKLQVVF